MMQLSDDRSRALFEFFRDCIQKGINQQLNQIERNVLKRNIAMFGEILSPVVQLVAQHPDQCDVNPICIVLSGIMATITRVKTTSGIKDFDQSQVFFYKKLIQDPECRICIILFITQLNFGNGNALLGFQSFCFTVLVNQERFNTVRTRVVGMIQQGYQNDSLAKNTFMFVTEQTFNAVADERRISYIKDILQEEEEEEEEEPHEVHQRSTLI
jgi:hypothetical protein